MKRQERTRRFDLGKLMTKLTSLFVAVGLILSLSTTQVSAKSLIEPGDENYIRVGGNACFTPYCPVPEPMYQTTMVPVGNSRTCVAGPEVFVGYSQVSDGAAGFVRMDCSSNPIYNIVKTEILNGIALKQAKGKKYGYVIEGTYAWTPQTEEEKTAYMNIAMNVVVDMIKDGTIKNGYVTYGEVSGSWLNGGLVEPKYYTYWINSDYSGENATKFFKKYPELKKYYKNGK